MNIELIDESEIKPDNKPNPKRTENFVKPKLVSKEDLRSCERTEKGATSNCAICQELNKEFFSRCNNKWNYDK